MALADDNRRELGSLPADIRVAAVVSTYHEQVTGGMFRSAARTLMEAGLDATHLTDVRVPGAFELPLVAQRLARRPDVDAVLCFGLVLKGQTDHDRYISSAVADALMRIGLETDTPVLFGLLTCNTLEQAEERARSREQGGLDKGHEVASALVHLVHAMDQAQGTPAGAGGRA